MKAGDRLQLGDWVKADIIGMGFYEVVSIDDFHINFKCLKIFMGQFPNYRGHVTNIHHGVDKKTGERIKIQHDKWLELKITRIK